MGYCHVELYPFSRNLCIKYEYQKLPIGQCNCSDIFQEIINELFNGLHYVRTDIYEVLIISDKSFRDHIKKLDKVLNK